MAANANGVANLSVTLKDDGGALNGGIDTSLAQTFVITVTAVNDAPTADAQSVTTNEDTAKAITLTGGDVDSTSLTFTIVSGPNHGALGLIGTPICTANGGGSSCTATVTYTPAPNYNGSDSFTFKVNDGTLSFASAIVSITVTPVNDVPVVTITAPPSGAIYAAGANVTFTGTFTDPDTTDTHTAKWSFTSSAGTTIAECPSASCTINESTGTVTLNITFTIAAIYHVQLDVTDHPAGTTGSANTVGGLDAFIVVYDPTAGFVTGGGWINSPKGAYTPVPSLTGKATFGFVSKYQKGQSTPSGNTEFQFQAAGLNFKATVFDWLTIAGARAQYKGSGTINGLVGNFGFMLTAIDGSVAGGGGTDRFRIKIWDKAVCAPDGTGCTPVYDNQIGALDTSDTADPTTALGGGSIVIHK